MELPCAASRELDSIPEYKNSILVGLPMIQSYINEKYAPPFGIYIHESARSFAPEGEDPFVHKWWQWFRAGQYGWTNKKTELLSEAMESYFKFASDNTINLDYPEEDINRHRNMFREYLSLE